MRTRSVVVVLLAVACTASPVMIPRGGPPEPCAFAGSGAEPTHHLRTKPVLGRFWIEETDSDEIAWVDPVTLRRLDAHRTELPSQGSVWAVSPSGHLVAAAPAPGIQIMNTGSLGAAGSLRTGGRWPRALSWLSDRLLAGVVEREVVVWSVDGARVRSLDLRGDERLMAWQAATGRLIVLVSPDPRNEEPSRLLDITRTGIAVIELDLVVGGHVPDLGQHGTSLTPDLAYDHGRGRVFIVQPDGPVAEVALDRRTVGYHRLGMSLLEDVAASLTPSAHAKLSDWATSRVAWLGGGMLAISGETARALDPVAGFSAGITLVDTRDWSSCLLNTRASHVAVSGGSLLAWGGGDFGEHGGVGLIGYDLATGRRWHRFGRQYLDVQFLGGYAYAINSWHGWFVSTVDVATGDILAERRWRPPTLLPSGAALQAA